ncbi:MAG: methyltransferase domain-containing protein [Patescibacteria group bacterium]
MSARSPWRHLLYKNLATISLSGDVIDLGGSRKSAYYKNFKGEFSLAVANMDDDTKDITVDLEQPFPIEASKYDHVLCINVLEHIFNYQNVIHETQRILKPGGQALFAVPFLIQVHPSPHDYWRFTGETLNRLFSEAGFTQVTVEPIGTGVCSAIVQMKSNLLHFHFLRHLASWLAFTGDAILARLYKKPTFSKEFYTLGYVIKAKK